MGDIYIWHVEGSLPPEEDRRWRQNLNITCLCATLSEATDLVKEEYPEIELHKIMRDRMAHRVLISESLGLDHG